ncbi:MAG: alpha/beta hydrolase [Planctomycetes bacterium]|nr:alpha/beta hydrolase [Planctomycetota bacterium]
MTKLSATLAAMLLTLGGLLLTSFAQPASKAVADQPKDKGPDQEEKMVVKEDVVYGRIQGAGLLADIAYPEGAGPFPVILSVHGGRWFRESKSTHSAIKVRQWARFGFFAVSIEYRLIGCTPAPACYQDVLCAIRWVHAHAGEYPIDRQRVFLIGQSAGGHLVSLAATLGEGPFKRTGGWEDQPHDFRGVIAVSAPYDLNKLDWGNGWTPLGEEPVAARQLASPIHHVSAKTKPILVIHSDDDHSVPIRQALDMVQVLEKAKVRHRFVHHKDKGHVSITDDVIREARAFVEEISGKQ